MEHFQKYCQILGVKPGSSAEEVRKNFRELIKKYHPDTNKNENDKQKVLTIIEAYSSFKNGVPKNAYPNIQNKPVVDPQAAQKFWKKNNVDVRKGFSYQEGFNTQSAQRIFDRIFSNKTPHQRVHNFFEEIINAEIYSENEDTVQWEVNFGKINSGEVNFGKINSGEVNFGKINSGEVNFGKINSGEVNFGKINSGEVNFGKFNSREVNFGKTNSSNFGKNNSSNFGNFKSGNPNFEDFETDEEISNKVKFGKINFREETDNDVFFEKTKFGHKNFREVRNNINNANTSKTNNTKTNFDNLSKFEQVEVTLVETVKSFEGKANRFQKTWSREFISQLIQIMVLYRDVVHQNPSNSYNALKRIRQITELVKEIKKNL